MLLLYSKNFLLKASGIVLPLQVMQYIYSSTPLLCYSFIYEDQGHALYKKMGFSSKAIWHDSSLNSVLCI